MRTVVAALGCLVAGCSVVISGPPRRPVAEVRPECTESLTVPRLDAVGAIASGTFSLLMFAAVTSCDRADEDCDNLGNGVGKTFGAIGLVAAGLYALSAYRGYHKVERCRVARADWDEQNS